MTETFSNIDGYIHQRRIKIQLTQLSLSVALNNFHQAFADIDAQAISRWESGKVTPSLLRQVLLIEFFGDNAYQILCDPNFKINRLATLSSYEKLLDKNLDLPHIQGSHPYIDKNQPFTKILTTEQHWDFLARMIVNFQSNIGRNDEIWDIAVIRDLLAFESSYSVMYYYDDIFAGHAVMFRVKPDAFKALMNYELGDNQLSVEHLAKNDDTACLFSLNGYGGSRAIIVDSTASFFSMAAEDASVVYTGYKSRIDVSVKALELLDADFIAHGEKIAEGKQGVKFRGHRYDSICYQLTKEKLLSSPIMLNLSRQKNASS
ncbi:MAG: hypothetical protein HRU20_30355 [Pseudomonadales bacterium]|nr:hypothetical protein [Pseudomonadales bacterium]